MSYRRSYPNYVQVPESGYYPQRQSYYGQGQQAHPQQQYKRSGAKYSKIKTGNYAGFTIVNAWNKSKSKGLITATVSPYHASKGKNGEQLMYVGEKNGNTYMKMICVVVYHNSGVEKIIPCSMNMETQVISLPDLSMVISPNGSGFTRSGKKATGYFGTFLKR